MRIVLIAEHASIDFGGEAALPCHYFRVLLSRNIDVHLVVHERSQAFLSRYFPEHNDRIHYVTDSKLHRFLHRCSQLPPKKLSSMIFGFLLQMITQVHQKKIAKQLIRDVKDAIIHQVIPVSPKAPSLMHGLGVPVMFGPLNGGMYYPEGFSQYHSKVSSYLDNIGRHLSLIITLIFRGKKDADIILVANPRSGKALPPNTAKVVELVENGVDLSVWQDSRIDTDDTDQNREIPRFIYVGRLVTWKAVDILIDAFQQACEVHGEMHLHIVGDGETKIELEQLAKQKGISENIIFEGWMPQKQVSMLLAQSDALLLSSLYECGGAVVLEAMATSIAVVATEWGGPADYIDASCGMLIPPTSRESMVEGFKDAIIAIAKDPEMAKAMGESGRKKIEQEYDWEKKVDKVMSLYQELLPTAPNQ